MRRYSCLIVVITLVALPGCSSRKSRATGSLYPVTDIVPIVSNTSTKGSPATLSDYIQATLKISSENTAAAEQALKQLHQRRPDLARLSARANADGRDVESRRQLAEAYMEAGLLPYAFQMYQEVKSIRPDDSPAEAGIANVWDRWGDYELGRQHAERAVLLDPRSPKALEILGRVHLHRNELDHALSAFLSAVQLSPQNASLLNNTGYVFLKRGDLLQARLYLEQAVARDGSLVEARNNLGITLARLGDRDRALQELMAVNDPAGAFNNLGVVYMSQKKWSEARDAFRRALALEPSHAKARANLAETEARMPFPSVVNLPGPKDGESVAALPAPSKKTAKLDAAAVESVALVTKKDSRLAAAYRDGLQRVRGRRYKEAIEIFQWLLRQNSSDALSSNCEYWIGQSYFGLADYGEAYAAFKRVTEYSSAARRNDALLMMKRASLKYRRSGRTT